MDSLEEGSSGLPRAQKDMWRESLRLVTNCKRVAPASNLSSQKSSRNCRTAFRTLVRWSTFLSSKTTVATRPTEREKCSCVGCARKSYPDPTVGTSKRSTTTTSWTGSTTERGKKCEGEEVVSSGILASTKLLTSPSTMAEAV